MQIIFILTPREIHLQVMIDESNRFNFALEMLFKFLWFEVYAAKQVVYLAVDVFEVFLFVLFDIILY